jgi:hypothetical protein
VTALTGERALEHRRKTESIAHAAAEKLGCTVEKLGAQASELVAAIRKLKRMATGAATGEAAPARIGGAVATAAKPATKSLVYHETRSAFKQAARALNVSLEEFS